MLFRSNEPGPSEFGNALCQLGFARTGRAFDEHRLAEALGEIDDAGNAVVGEVVDALQAASNLFDGGECG